MSINISGLDKVKDYLNKRIDALLKAIIEELEVVAEKMKREAVLNGNYLDQTGALRSSIGYVIVFNGVIWSSGGFDEAGSPIAPNKTLQDQGAEQGRSLAEELANAKQDKGIYVFLVAGRHYAKYVERNYNVLDSARLVGEKLLDELKDKIKNNDL